VDCPLGALTFEQKLPYQIVAVPKNSPATPPPTVSNAPSTNTLTANLQANLQAAPSPIPIVKSGPPKLAKLQLSPLILPKPKKIPLKAPKLQQMVQAKQQSTLNVDFYARKSRKRRSASIPVIDLEDGDGESLGSQESERSGDANDYKRPKDPAFELTKSDEDFIDDEEDDLEKDIEEEELDKDSEEEVIPPPRPQIEQTSNSEPSTATTDMLSALKSIEQDDGQQRLVPKRRKVEDSK
jgi:hypothetical protein